MQRRRAGRRRLRGDVGARFEQRFDGRNAAGRARQVQRCVLTDAGHRVHVGAGVGEHFDQRGVAVLGRPVQRRHTVALPRARVGALLQQRAHGVAVALHCGIGDQ